MNLQESILHSYQEEELFFQVTSIFAVSAINLTPANKIISALFDAAFCERARLSPTKSAIS